MQQVDTLPFSRDFVRDAFGMHQNAAVMESDIDEARPLVELWDVGKQFGGVFVVSGVHLALRPGEVHALLGETARSSALTPYPCPPRHGRSRTNA